MRYSLTATFLVVAMTLTTIAARGEEPSLPARMAARRELEQAKTELRYYRQVEYPRQCRELDAAIEFTRAEIDDNKTLLREFRPFTQFSLGKPYPITVRNLQTCIKAAEFRLRDLWAERNALAWFHSDQIRQLSAQVHEARVRIVELEPAMAEPATVTRAGPRTT